MRRTQLVALVVGVLVVIGIASAVALGTFGNDSAADLDRTTAVDELVPASDLPLTEPQPAPVGDQEPGSEPKFDTHPGVTALPDNPVSSDPRPQEPTAVADPPEAFDGIRNFEQCAAAGNPVMESYPEQCRTPDGRLFVKVY